MTWSENKSIGTAGVDQNDYSGPPAGVDKIIYPGHKGNSIFLPQIFNHIPEHKLFVDLFAGSGSVAKNIYDARCTEHIIANDIDTKVCRKYLLNLPGSVGVLNYDFRKVIDLLDLVVKFHYLDREDVFIYADPPYVISSRKRPEIYAYELSDAGHVSLIRRLFNSGYKFMISGYESDLYKKLFDGLQYFQHQFTVGTHAGSATEFLWMNYDISKYSLATYKFSGINKTERQRIKRKGERLITKINALPKIEREFIINTIKNL